MKKYIIYMHTNTKNKKKYIGYTKFKLEERLHKHYLNAISGIDTKFYRAIRKYGLEVFESKILETTNNKSDALSLEKEFITLFDTYKSGYNSNQGGSGGWIIGDLDSEQQELWKQKISESTTGKNNPNHSGYSDDDLIDFAIKIYKKEGNFYYRLWSTYSKKNGYPQNFSKNRFNGDFNLFVNLVENKLGVKFDGYKPTKKHRENLSKVNKGKRWINNGFISKQHDITNGIPKGFKLGRIKLKDKTNKNGN